MNVLNLDGTLCGLDIDLSSKLHNLPQSKYIITQNILNGMKQYTIINTWKNKILYPDDDFNIRLIDSNGKQVKTSMKKIVRLIYDSEYCVDDIEDEPGEFWVFIDLYEVSKTRKYPMQNSKESFRGQHASGLLPVRATVPFLHNHPTFSVDSLLETTNVSARSAYSPPSSYQPPIP